MGSGKSLIGYSLAQKFQTEFIDLDKEIEKKRGCSISDFFRIHGETEFRNEEATLLREIGSHHNSFVIATGGGTPCFHNNMRWMNETGKTIYLKVSVETLISRLKRDRINRPLISSLPDKNFETYIEALFKERENFYMQSAIELSPEIFTPGALFEHIKGILHL